MNADQSRRICSIPECSRRHYGRGWCKAHYERWRQHGNPLAGRTPPGEPDRFLREIVLKFTGEDCLNWPYGGIHNYGIIKRDGRSQPVHRIVCETVHGKPPSRKHQAAHNCGNSKCCNPNHLRWATPAENQADRVIHGTHVRGDRHPLAKLTERDVRTIHSLRGKKTQRELAKRFGVSLKQISDIQRGKSWSWLRPDASCQDIAICATHGSGG